MRYIAIVNEWNWFHQNLWLDSSTGKKNPLKYAPVPKCGFVAQLLVAPALYLGDVGSNQVEAWIFFTFLCCNCLNCSSSKCIQGSLLYTIFTRRLNKIYFLKKNYGKQYKWLFHILGRVSPTCPEFVLPQSPSLLFRIHMILIHCIL